MAHGISAFAPKIHKNMKLIYKEKIHKVTFLSFIIFVISLPFTGIELDLLSISRLEIKITMITFSLLFIGWLLGNLEFPRRRDSREILFYSFAFMYTMAQFTSLINSPLPSDSIKQGIIILSLITMMIVVSETILDKKMAEYVLTGIGALSLLIGIVAVLNYYVSGHTGRLGQPGSFVLGMIDLGGDPQYLGDIFLYTAGAVLFVSLQLYKRKYWKYLIWPCLILWFSAVTLTLVKALFVSMFCFFVISLILMKGKRYFVILNLIVFILAIVANYHLKTYGAFSRSKAKLISNIVLGKVDSKAIFGQDVELIEQIISSVKNRAGKEIDDALREVDDLADDLTKSYEGGEKDRIREVGILRREVVWGIHKLLTRERTMGDVKDTIDKVSERIKANMMTNKLKERFQDTINNVIVRMKTVEDLKRQERVEIDRVMSSLPKNIERKMLIDGAKGDLQILSRLNVFSGLGLNSVNIRLKGVVVSVLSSLDAKWFGHGAGLSQKLLPELSNRYDKIASDDEKRLMKRLWIYGKDANKSLIDSHVLLLTEFFNVGLMGLISLICLILFVIVEQIKTIKRSKAENGNINELLFATLIAMLVYRLSGSLVVIPFLWFILGLSFGVCKLNWKKVSCPPQV